MLRRHWIPITAVCVAAALIALLAYGINSSGENTSIDSQIAHGHPPLAPDTTDALGLLGTSQRRTLADYRGKVVVLNIFASWCTTCLGELPTLQQAQQQLPREGATVLGVTYQDNSDADIKFMAQHHLTYPVIQDVNGDLVHAFGTNQVPETFVINRAGRVTAVERGPITAQWLQQKLKADGASFTA